MLLTVKKPDPRARLGLHPTFATTYLSDFVIITFLCLKCDNSNTNYEVVMSTE